MLRSAAQRALSESVQSLSLSPHLAHLRSETRAYLILGPVAPHDSVRMGRYHYDCCLWMQSQGPLPASPRFPLITVEQH